MNYNEILAAAKDQVGIAVLVEIGRAHARSHVSRKLLLTGGVKAIRSSEEDARAVLDDRSGHIQPAIAVDVNSDHPAQASALHALQALGRARYP